MDNRHDPESVEDRLRRSAPVVPAHLRGTILMRCQEARYSAAPRRARGPIFRPYASAFALFLFACWSANGWVDAQNRALLSGRPGAQGIVRANPYPREAPINECLQVLVRRRIHQLAILIHENING